MLFTPKSSEALPCQNVNTLKCELVAKECICVWLSVNVMQLLQLLQAIQLFLSTTEILVCVLAFERRLFGALRLWDIPHLNTLKLAISFLPPWLQAYPPCVASALKKLPLLMTSHTLFMKQTVFLNSSACPECTFNISQKAWSAPDTQYWDSTHQTLTTLTL